MHLATFSLVRVRVCVRVCACAQVIEYMIACNTVEDEGVALEVRRAHVCVCACVCVCAYS